MPEGIDFEQQIAQDRAIKEHMDAIGKKILVMSGKGGVGKTTVTINLANALVDSGRTVGILDTDLHGPNVAKMLGCEGASLVSNDEGKTFEPVQVRPGLKVMSLAFATQEDQPIVWRGPMKMSAIRQFLEQANWGPLDYLLIDSPPGTGDEQLTVCQSIRSMTGSIIVTTPQDVAILDARRSVNFSKQLKLPVLGVVENMSGLICPHCGEEIDLFGKGGGKKLAEETGVPFLGSIPIELPVREDEDKGTSVLKDKPQSASTKAFLAIAAQIDGSKA
ncbi:MAG: Mrp/NBP35 family ATP-binding protein [Sphaerochaeta sp.]|jgi:Mrp family chromosome partitioning ATPase|nr:Mrp/NBP35 family ATP-binding protein [Sphaerochaeta sp.]MCI2045768.1 Mrp/NBP35 family ATP-binding protein [Sphaerochaeta sp.]MCI2077092.1 Mrp/NBP35 family ATP-binding protein [Sphaerochaeta sp.]